MSYHYVYRITNTIKNQHYYGKRKCDRLPKNDLGIKYFSSSRNMDFMDDQRLNPQDFKYKIIKIYQTNEQATLLEVKLHDKFMVDKNPHFYNLARQTSTGFVSVMTDEERKRRSDRWKGLNNPNHTVDRTGAKNGMFGSARFGVLNPFYGKTHSEESKNMMRQNKLKNPLDWNDESRQKLKDAWKRRPIVQCPHCGLQSINANNMNRYHFDKCKSINN